MSRKRFMGASMMLAAVLLVPAAGVAMANAADEKPSSTSEKVETTLGCAAAGDESVERVPADAATELPELSEQELGDREAVPSGADSAEPVAGEEATVLPDVQLDEDSVCGDAAVPAQ